MTIRADIRLADSPLVPVACGRCGAQVHARKSSWQQTTVQWDAAALAACTERRETDPAGGPFLGCSQLRDSVDDAVRQGALPILDEGAPR
jgi:hypothetical protein